MNTAGFTRVLHSVPDIALHSGGPSRSVVDIVDALSTNSDLQISLLTDLSIGTPNFPKSPQVSVLNTYSAKKPFWVPKALETKKLISEEAPSIIHSHGLWTPSTHWASKYAIQNNIPLAVAPHGMLERWSLQQKPIKKRIALALYQRRTLDSAAIFFATADQEAESIRELGLKQPIAVIPNGISFPDQTVPRIKNRLGKKTVLFLSRIHQKKGLINLINAWSILRPSDWSLVIAGPDEGNFLSKVLQHISSLSLNDSIRYIGEVNGKEKTELFFSSDVFVLPTYSENFGIVVAEALAHGVPVITTKGAPWGELETEKCGWWIDIGTEPLVSALRKAITMQSDALGDMGLRGRSLAKKFGWQGIAADTAAAYSWLLGRELKPNFVHTS